MKNLTEHQARDVRSLLHPFTPLRKHEEQGPLVIARGEGVYVFDEHGQRYIEGLSGLWCAGLGFSEPRLVEAAKRQLETLPYYHQFGGKSHLPGIELADRLVALAPAGITKAFFVNSGSEANDTQIKLVRYYHEALGKPEKIKIIARQRAYHGVTLAAASLTGLPYVTQGFQLPIPGILHTMAPHHYREALPGETEEAFATGCAEELERLILAEGPETVGAFIAEPLMGAGGVIVPPRGYFEKIQPVLRKYDVLMIADEVITGFGRTGNYWGCETFNVEPDLISVAKQLSSAYLPIGAVLMSDRIYQVLADRSAELGTFGHGYTYSGHPVCAAVALEALKIYDERDIVGQVRGRAPRFAELVAGLGDNPLVGHTRAVGLIGAAELMADKDKREPFDPARAIGARVMAACQDEGLIIRAIGDTVAFCPPMIIEEDQLGEMFASARRALDRVADELAGEARQGAA